jgi:hypothetical protein
MRLGLRVAAHDFFHGLLFYSGLELLHLTLGGILHIAVFITLCEAFLGLWKHFFHIGVEGRPLPLVGGGGTTVAVGKDEGVPSPPDGDPDTGWKGEWFMVQKLEAIL